MENNKNLIFIVYILITLIIALNGFIFMEIYCIYDNNPETIIKMIKSIKIPS